MNIFLYLVSILASLIHLNDAIEQLDAPKYFEDKLQPIYGDVVYSSIIFRHGDRNEVYPFPTDRYADDFEEAGMGHLVKAGRQRAYRLGRWARARYAHLLKGRSYTSGFMKVASSEVERTINSAQLFLAGFYPPEKKDEWNENIPWYPIAVYPVPSYKDNVISMSAHCARFNEEMEYLKDMPDMKEFYKRHDEEKFFKFIEDHTKLEIPRDDPIIAITVLYGLYDTLFVQENLGLEHPPWAKEVYPEPLGEMQRMYFQMITYNDTTKRLKAGPLTEHITHAMLKSRDESQRRIFHIYSGHDTTLANLMNSWGIYRGTPPPYSAALLVELRQKNEQFIVTVSYRDSEDKFPTLLKIPKCKYPCTLDDFIETTGSLIPDHWKEECEVFEPDYNSILF